MDEKTIDNAQNDNEVNAEREKLNATLETVIYDLERTRKEHIRATYRQDRLIENQETILSWLKQINNALGAAGNAMSSITFRAND